MYYTTEKIGPKRSLTPEGYMICSDVPLARTGEQIYGPNETPIGPSRSGGPVRIMREPEEVFRPETIASAIGKPLTIQHPSEMAVTPSTWRSLACGHVMNVRRGEGPDADVLLGDLFVTDPEAISLIDEGLREVSMGYDTDYDELGDPGSGIGRQRNIVFNHVALVDQGRCGPRCAIGDHSTCDGSTTESTTMKSKFMRILDRAFKAKDEKEKEEIMKEAEAAAKDEAGEGGHHIEVHNHLPEGAKDEEAPPWFKEHAAKTDARCQAMEDAIAKLGDAHARDRAKDGEAEEAEKKKKEEEERRKAEEARDADEKKIEGELEMEAPPGTGDKARKANDSAYLEDSFQRTIADAEILAPGIRAPTFDRAAKPRGTFDAICGLRRSAIDLAYGQPETRGMIEMVLGAGRALDTRRMSCADTRTLFNSVSALKKAANNGANVSGAARVADLRGTPAAGPIKSIADLNRINRERWDGGARKAS